MRDQRTVVGIRQPLISESKYMDYNILEKLVNPHPHFIVGNILLEEPADHILLKQQFDKIGEFLDSKPLLKMAVYAITRFDSIYDWEAVRVFEMKPNLYEEVKWGIVGTSSIKVEENNCEIVYWSVFRNTDNIKVSA